ncbi:MAG TPA: hypothetical protein VFA18_11170 [Gemmataceae bacterium]|nr:hypothetical protein [Gemmataceae bacterium]
MPTADSQPWGIAAGPDGALWFTEQAGNLLGRITTKGALVEYPIATVNSQPTGIITGPDHNLWWTEAPGGKLGQLNATIVVTPAAAKTLVLTGTSSSVAGAPYTITVTARDPYGNVATGYRGTIHFTSTDTAATLPPDYMFTAADGGMHEFVNGVTFNTVGTQTLKATDTQTSTITGKKTVSVTAPAPLMPSFAGTLDGLVAWSAWETAVEPGLSADELFALVGQDAHGSLFPLEMSALPRIWPL